jgi:integrase
VRDRRGRYLKWIDPVIGTRPIAGLGRVDRQAIRSVVARLDRQIAQRAAFHRGEIGPKEGHKPGLSAKTAANVWGELTAAFDEACTSKDDGLRVRAQDDNPTTGVQPPEKGDHREQAALYPSEVLALLSCVDVPHYRREVYALCLYAGLRQAECRGLVAGDIDFEHGIVNVRRQRRARGAAGKTKTRAGVRQIPIEGVLEPLLRLLVKRAEAGPLVRVPPMEDCAERMREDLRRAECTRAELYRDDDERQHFTFHGLRHTCLTHWAVAQRPLPWIRAAAGHAGYDATQHYVDLGAILRGQRFGEPHPPLPRELLRSTEWSISQGAPEMRVRRQKQTGRNRMGFSPSSHVALATPAGIEGSENTHEMPSKQAFGREEDVALASVDDVSRGCEDASDAGMGTSNPDDALRGAIHAAVDAGLYDRAVKLIEVLKSAPTVAPVVDSTKRR